MLVFKIVGKTAPYGTPMYLLLLSVPQPYEEKVPLGIPNPYAKRDTGDAMSVLLTNVSI